MNTFQTLLSRVQQQSSRRLLVALTIAGVLLSSWAWWFTSSSVPLTIVSSTARIRVGAADYSVASPLAGTIVHVAVQVGDVVKKGAELLEIDATPDLARLDEARRRVFEGRVQLDRAHATADRAVALLKNVEQERTHAQGAAGGALMRSRAELTIAVQRLTAASALAKDGLISKLELEEATGTVAVRRADVESNESALERTQYEYASRVNEARQMVEAARYDAEAIRGNLQAAVVQLRRTTQELDQRKLRSPVEGIVGELWPAPIGAFLQQGQFVARIVPLAPPKIVAEFDPAAIGMIRSGQTAWMTFDGFPPALYGRAKARVERRSAGTAGHRLQAELSFAKDQPELRIEIEDGLEGTVEVVVATVPPMSLLVRRFTAVPPSRSD